MQVIVKEGKVGFYDGKRVYGGDTITLKPYLLNGVYVTTEQQFSNAWMIKVITDETPQNKISQPAVMFDGIAVYGDKINKAKRGRPAKQK
jgi:hypothetical protein